MANILHIKEGEVANFWFIIKKKPAGHSHYTYYNKKRGSYKSYEPPTYLYTEYNVWPKRNLFYFILFDNAFKRTVFHQPFFSFINFFSLSLLLLLPPPSSNMLKTRKSPQHSFLCAAAYVLCISFGPCIIWKFRTFMSIVLVYLALEEARTLKSSILQ